MEYHDYTAEIQMPMDADVVLVCAPPNGGEIAAREAEAFLIPKGTMVCLHPGTWHDVLYPVDSEQASILIGLPERIYHNDIVVKNFEDCVVQVEFKSQKHRRTLWILRCFCVLAGGEIGELDLYSGSHAQCAEDSKSIVVPVRELNSLIYILQGNASVGSYR